MSAPAFSVLMPVYINDAAPFVSEALKSLLAQSLQPSEFVFVKDGPVSAEVDDLILEFNKATPSIVKVVALKTNSGMGVAMNMGLRECSSPYVARMDADDICRPNRFETQFQYLEAHPQVDVLGSYIEEFGEKPGDLGSIRRVPTEQAEIILYARRRNPINHMSAVFKRERAMEAGGYWIRRVYEDYNLWYQMLRTGSQFHNLPDVLMDVRVGTGMVKRRSGIKYFRIEAVFFLQMYKDQYFKMSLPRLFLELVIRFILRTFPAMLIDVMYARILRSRADAQY